MKAIALPYACYQNEPSTPLKKILDLPTNKVERDAMLIDLFCEEVMRLDDDQLLEVTVTERQDSNEYGDITVAYDDEVFLFITFIEE